MAVQQRRPLIQLCQWAGALQRDRLRQFTVAGLGHVAEPVAQFQLGLAGAPEHTVVVGLAAAQLGRDAHRHASCTQLGAQAGFSLHAIGRVLHRRGQHLRRAQHALQGEDEVRQHLAREAAFRAFGQPGASLGLPGPRPSSEGHRDLHLLQCAQRHVGGGAEGELQGREPRRGGEREIHRGTQLLALDALDAGTRGLEVHAQRLLAQHAQAGVEAQMAQLQMGGRRGRDVEAVQAGARDQRLGAVGGAQLGVLLQAGGQACGIGVPDHGGAKPRMALHAAQHALPHHAQANDADVQDLRHAAPRPVDIPQWRAV
ncbi:hypothetical protein WG898_09895 [Paucibacter sp. AS307]|uniref:hypothetical protein n=1 Tax=Paucibacter soli TaxID=3133433 RepID=UPI0030A6D375